MTRETQVPEKCTKNYSKMFICRYVIDYSLINDIDNNIDPQCVYI